MAEQMNDHDRHENSEQQFMRKVLERLDELVMVGQQSLATQNETLKAIQALAPQTTEKIGNVFGTPVPINKEK